MAGAKGRIVGGVIAATAVVGVFLSSFPSPAAAALLKSGCADEYVAGQAPDLSNEKLSNRIREVCFSQFGVFHSGVTATPLFVGQRLTAPMVRAAKGVDRNDVFHAEAGLPAAERSELSHYRGSGYDRGHMAPAADMASDAANDESFSLSNMVPQLPGLNRGPWADIEETVRRFALKYGEVYVVTGPAFGGARLAKIGGRVIVPTSAYKAVYVPSTGQSSAWWADNATGAMEVVSVSELGKRIGADVFPAVSVTSKDALVSLPLPKGAGKPTAKPGRVDVEHVSSIGTAQEGQSWWSWVVAIALSIIEFVLRSVLKG